MFMWGSAAEWAGFAGEILVALAIVWELDETRRANFLSTSANFGNLDHSLRSIILLCGVTSFVMQPSVWFAP
jgi:hypothetical protein